MARIRTVKPDFFQHEALYDAERESGLPLRIAFAGLWTVADKKGRFEWRPRQLKLNVLPYDEVDFSAVLSALEEHGFLVRYDVEGKSYAYIPSWNKHQHINVREPDSTIPGPFGAESGEEPDDAGTSTGPVPDQAAGKGREGKGKEGERTRAVHATRLPDDFELTPERRAVAEAERLPADRTFAKFTDYWRAQAGAKARKLDWDATWRNWCRSEFDRNGSVAKGTAPNAEAQQAWQDVLDEKPRTPRMQAAVDAAGGWQRIRGRTEFDGAKIRAEFFAAFANYTGT